MGSPCECAAGRDRGGELPSKRSDERTRRASKAQRFAASFVGAQLVVRRKQVAALLELVALVGCLQRVPLELDEAGKYLAGCVYWFGIDGTFCSVDAVELDRVFQQFHAVSNGLDELSFGVEWEAVYDGRVVACFVRGSADCGKRLTLDFSQV